jgi:N-acetylneuraminate lyase
MFDGITIAFYACYDDNGRISTQRALSLAQHYYKAGVTGLYLNGSSGEGMLLTTKERMLIAEAVCGEYKDKLSIMVHVGALSTDESISLAEHAQKAGAHAVASIPPFYYRLSDREVSNHWQIIKHSTDLPLYIYNIPSTTQHVLSKQLFEKMVQLNLAQGIKDSSRDMANLLAWRQIAGDEFIILNGADDMYLAGKVMSANGGIGGSYGVMAKLFVALDQSINNKDYEKAQHLQKTINCFIGRIKQAANGLSYIGACKKVLEAGNLHTGGVRRPLMDEFETGDAVFMQISEDIASFESRL